MWTQQKMKSNSLFLLRLMPELPAFDDEDLKSYGEEEEESTL